MVEADSDHLDGGVGRVEEEDGGREGKENETEGEGSVQVMEETAAARVVSGEQNDGVGVAGVAADRRVGDIVATRCHCRDLVGLFSLI